MIQPRIPMVFSRLKALVKHVLKTVGLYGIAKNVVKSVDFFFYKYRVILQSRFAAFERHYSNFQITSGKKTVCVIISCFNHLEYTKQAIDSYYASLDDDYNYVLMLMDDHSTDQTKAFSLDKVKELSNICYLRYRKNMGLTQLWNDGVLVALKEIKPDYVFLINNDIIIPKAVFSKLVAHLKDYKGIGAIGPLTNSPGYYLRQDIRRFYAAYAASDLKTDIQAAADIIKENKPLELEYINGFFMGFPREAFERNVHSYFLFKPFYFNPLNRNVHNEDEFLVRLKQAGFKILMATDVFVFHYKDVSQHRYNNGEVALYRRKNN